MARSSSLHPSPLLGVATAVVALAVVLCGSNSVYGVRVAPGMHTTTSDKLMIGYFFNLFKYDPHGGKQPLPPGITNAAELLEAEMGDIIPNYNVVIHAFISPASFNGTAIVDTPEMQQWRDGVNGKPGLKQLCAKHNIPLMVSIGGGGAPRLVPTGDPTALVNALYDYVVKHGYAGIDIDEENTVDVETYVNFLVALGKKFKGATIGTPAARASADHQDASQLKHGGAWDLDAGSTMAWWQAETGQKLCGVTPSGPQQHGIVSNVGAGACQFIDFALHMNWPSDKLVFGMPLYAKTSPPIVWYQIMEQGYSKVTADANALMTVYAKSGDLDDGASSSSGLYLVSPTDVASRIEYTMSSTRSRLGVSLDNGGWQSKIMSCGKFDSNSTHVHATLGGIGFWEMSHEDAAHHEVSTAAAAALKSLP